MKKIYIPFNEENISSEFKELMEKEEGSFFVIDTPENRIRFDEYLPLGFRGIKNLDLEINLIPRTSWSASLSNSLTKESWDSIRKPIVESHNNRCCFCGSTGVSLSKSIRDIDTHELWQYSDLNQDPKVQKLIGFICLCSSCHLMFHLGFAETIGKQKQTIKRLKALEKKSDVEIQQKVEKIFNLWEKRSHYSWEIDITRISKNNPIKNSFIKFKNIEKVNNTKFII